MADGENVLLGNPAIRIDLQEAIYSLSNALDLVGIDEVQHGKRVGYMAMQCGHRLGLDVHAIHDLYEIGLLHDCGVSSSRVHQHLVEELDWRESHEHCQVGYELLKDFAPCLIWPCPFFTIIPIGMSLKKWIFRPWYLFPQT